MPLSHRIGRRDAARRRATATAGLLTVPVLWLVVLFVAPVAIVGLYSVGLLTLFPGDGSFSLDGWSEFFESSVYPSLLWKSVRIALVVAVACVILAYPIAYCLAMLAGRRKYTSCS